MNYEEGMEALEELGATPVPFICNDDGDYDTCHLRDSKPNEYSIVRLALSAPTYEDAVKVVEEIAYKCDNGTYSKAEIENLIGKLVCADLLTALRERGKKE